MPLICAMVACCSSLGIRQGSCIYCANPQPQSPSSLCATRGAASSRALMPSSQTGWCWCPNCYREVCRALHPALLLQAHPAAVAGAGTPLPRAPAENVGQINQGGVGTRWIAGCAHRSPAERGGSPQLCKSSVSILHSQSSKQAVTS